MAYIKWQDSHIGSLMAWSVCEYFYSGAGGARFLWVMAGK